MSPFQIAAVDSDLHLGTLMTVVMAAGNVVLSGFRSGASHETKSDASPVTEFDCAAERLITKQLSDYFPSLPIVAEEEVSEGHIPPFLGRRFFLVDPLDGTKEYVAGIPDFTVNIALVEDGVPICGVVLAPAHGELFTGSKLGAFRSRRQSTGSWTELKPIEARERPADIVALASRSHRTEATDTYLSQFDLCSVTPMGSSLKYCRIAEGAADIYPCLGRTMEWDIAAAHAVLRAAGGDIRTLDGRTLRYGKRRQAEDIDFANPPLVATGLGPSQAVCK